MAAVIHPDKNVDPDENWRDRIVQERWLMKTDSLCTGVHPKNVNTKSVLYYRIHRCWGGQDNKHKVVVKFSDTGLMEPFGFLQEADHTCQCCMINGLTHIMGTIANGRPWTTEMSTTA